MHSLRATQIKAARALLDWSQDDLASATGLSVATIRNLEMGFMSPRHSTMHVIREVVENAGVEFTDQEGVRRRLNEVKVYCGQGSEEAFLEDVQRTISRMGGEVLITIKSTEVLAQLTRLKGTTDVRCVLCETVDTKQLLLPFKFRVISKRYIDPVPFHVYGDKYAIALQEGASFRIVVFQSAPIAHMYTQHFNSLWENAVPLSTRHTDVHKN